MKRSILLIAMTLLVNALIAQNNAELQDMFVQDQQARRAANIDWKKLSKDDRAREDRVYEMLEQGLVVTGKDHYNAAMIFQHGIDRKASAMAVEMMKKAVALDSTVNKWLLAAAIDRDLKRNNKPQIYGTQYTRKKNGPWELYEVDESKITDQERAAMNVPPLAKAQERAIMMNKKKLNELLEEGKTINEIIAFIKKEDFKTSAINLSEGSINSFGYELMAIDKNEDALMILQLNTELFPNGYNTYDSLGECLLKLGKKEASVSAYKKSLELNPNNQNAKDVLVKMKID